MGRQTLGPNCKGILVTRLDIALFPAHRPVFQMTRPQMNSELPNFSIETKCLLGKKIVGLKNSQLNFYSVEILVRCQKFSHVWPTIFLPIILFKVGLKS